MYFVRTFLRQNYETIKCKIVCHPQRLNPRNQASEAEAVAMVASSTVLMYGVLKL